jgi:hypothetical protein
MDNKAKSGMLQNENVDPQVLGYDSARSAYPYSLRQVHTRRLSMKYIAYVHPVLPCTSISYLYLYQVVGCMI